MIAVGTGIAPRPPHGSGRAQLRHPVLTSSVDGKAHTWPGTKVARLREKSLANREIRSHVKRSFWLRRRSVRSQRHRLPPSPSVVFATFGHLISARSIEASSFRSLGGVLDRARKPNHASGPIQKSKPARRRETPRSSIASGATRWCLASLSGFLGCRRQ